MVIYNIRLSPSGGALPRWGTKQVAKNQNTVPPLGKSRWGTCLELASCVVTPTPTPTEKISHIEKRVNSFVRITYVGSVENIFFRGMKDFLNRKLDLRSKIET